jgi:hypothetical protein
VNTTKNLSLRCSASSLAKRGFGLCFFMGMSLSKFCYFTSITTSAARREIRGLWLCVPVWSVMLWSRFSCETNRFLPVLSVARNRRARSCPYRMNDRCNSSASSAENKFHGHLLRCTPCASASISSRTTPDAFYADQNQVRKPASNIHFLKHVHNLICSSVRYGLMLSPLPDHFLSDFLCRLSSNNSIDQIALIGKVIRFRSSCRSLIFSSQREIMRADTRV